MLELMADAFAAATQLRPGATAALDRSWEHLEVDDAPPVELRAAIIAAPFNGIDIARDMISTLYARPSSAAFFSGHPLERVLRDVHEVTPRRRWPDWRVTSMTERHSRCVVHQHVDRAVLGRLSSHTFHGVVVGAVLLVPYWLMAARLDVILNVGDDRQLIDRWRLDPARCPCAEDRGHRQRTTARREGGALRHPQRPARSRAGRPRLQGVASRVCGLGGTLPRRAPGPVPASAAVLRARRLTRVGVAVAAFVAALAVRCRARWVDLGDGDAVLERRPWGRLGVSGRVSVGRPPVGARHSTGGRTRNDPRSGGIWTEGG